MSRKLLMNNVVASGGSRNYIENTVFHLDGINNTREGHSETTKIWEDLSGNNNDVKALDATNNSRVYFESNKVVTQVMLAGTKNISLNDFTIEVIYRCPVQEIYGSYVFLFTIRNGNPPSGHIHLIYDKDTKKMTLTFKTNIDTARIRFDVDTENIRHISVTYDKISKKLKGYLNGTLIEEVTLDSTSEYAINVPPTIFGWNNQYGYEGTEMYGARVYNRVLTDEERINNYMLDKERFNF